MCDNEITVFQTRLGIEAYRTAMEAKPWRVAVGDTRDDAIETGGRGVHAVRQFSVNTVKGAKAGTQKIAESAVERLPWHEVGCPATSPGPEAAEEEGLPKGTDV